MGQAQHVHKEGPRSSLEHVRLGGIPTPQRCPAPSQVGTGTPCRPELEQSQAPSRSAPSRAPPPRGWQPRLQAPPVPQRLSGARPPMSTPAASPLGRMAEIPEDDQWGIPDDKLPEVPPPRPVPSAGVGPALSGKAAPRAEEDRWLAPPAPRPSVESSFTSCRPSVDSQPPTEAGGQLYFGHLMRAQGASAETSPRTSLGPPSAWAQRTFGSGLPPGLDLAKRPSLRQSTGLPSSAPSGSCSPRTLPTGSARPSIAPPAVDRGDTDDFDTKAATIRALFQLQEERRKEEMLLRTDARLLGEARSAPPSARPSVERGSLGSDGRPSWLLAQASAGPGRGSVGTAASLGAARSLQCADAASEELDAVAAARRDALREREKREAVATFLAQQGFTGVNAKRRSTKQGTFPLHVAAERGDRRLVWHLLEEGADPSLRNCSGQTPAEVALERDRGGSHAEVLAVLHAAPPVERADSAPRRSLSLRLFGIVGRSRSTA